jgi:hypothetical protein
VLQWPLPHVVLSMQAAAQKRFPFASATQQSCPAHVTEPLQPPYACPSLSLQIIGPDGLPETSVIGAHAPLEQSALVVQRHDSAPFGTQIDCAPIEQHPFGPHSLFVVHVATHCTVIGLPMQTSPG